MKNRIIYSQMTSAYFWTSLTPFPPCQHFYTLQFRNFIQQCQHFTNPPPPPRVLLTSFVKVKFLLTIFSITLFQIFYLEGREPVTIMNVQNVLRIIIAQEINIVLDTPVYQNTNIQIIQLKDPGHGQLQDHFILTGKIHVSPTLISVTLSALQLPSHGILTMIHTHSPIMTIMILHSILQMCQQRLHLNLFNELFLCLKQFLV